MKPTTFIGLAAPVSLLSGCVSTSFRAARDVNTRTFAPVSPAMVRVLDAPPPGASFQLLGEVEAYLSGFPNDETVFRKARERAARVGADAIILASAMQVVRPLGDLPYSRQVASVTFTAIRFLPVDSSQHHQ